jgi:hypothetical protein
MSEKIEKKFFLKIEVNELNDKSFDFKVEGTMPVSIQSAIETAITGIKKVGPSIVESIANIPEPNSEAEQAKIRVKKYFDENPPTAIIPDAYISQAAKDLGLTVLQVQEAIKEAFVPAKKEEKKE